MMNAAAGIAAKMPETVPPELVWDVDFDAFTAEGDDPYLALTRMHDLPPVVWSTSASYGRPGWVATRSDVISEVMIDWEHFTAERHGMIADLVGENVRLNPIEIDPPAHHGYRRILNPFFTPKAVKELDAPVRQACVELIEKFADKGGCDFVEEFAIPFPSYVFLDLMGMPRDKLDDFIGWENDIMRAPDPMDRVKAARAVYAYLKEHKDKQKISPSNDFLRGMTSGTVDGRPLDHLELMGMFYVLYVGGLDTVYSTIGWTLLHLARNPALQDRLRDHPELVPAAVEEFARAFSVVVTHRQVVNDYIFHGAPLRAGDEIHLPLALANRDPAVFDRPHDIDIDRAPRHIAFGTGTHNCLGIHLAKREIRIVIEEFLKRFRNIRIPEGAAWHYHTGRTFGLDSLPLVWDKV
jgi:cytochrome P450